MRISVAIVIALLSGAVCAAEPESNAALQKLFDDEWEYGLRESPTFASHLGDKRYNDRWPDVSPEAIARRQAHQRELLERLQQFDPGQLSPSDRLNHRLFRWQAELDVEGQPFGWHLVPINQREGIQDEGSLGDSISFDAVKDYEDWLLRIERFPVYMDQTIGLLREGLKRGILQPQIVLKRVPQQIRRQIVEDPEQSLFYKPFRTFPKDLAEAERTRLQTAARTAIALHIVPAYQKLLTFFEDDYLPGSLKDVGVWQVPQGGPLYSFAALQFTTTSLTPDQIHEIGLQEVSRIRAGMETIRQQVGFQGTLPEFFEHLRTAPEFRFEKPQDLLQAYQAFCKRVDPLLTRVFRKLPRIPYGVEAIPEHMAPDTTTAYYRPPAADGTRAGIYFVNLYQVETRPKYEIAALSLHEAVPGHHLQIALATEMEHVPTFRRFTGFTAYVEGWALYSESLGDELGVYDDPYSKFGQLTYEMWRAVRLVVDTGIHHKHWSRDRAITFFRDNAAKSEQDIVNEIDRYISWPGQALAYKIGELKIRELRRKCQAELGDRFDLREFHDVVLRNGAVPLSVLEELVDEWLAEQKPERQ
ncbi:DUF885 domain-containing protein [Planctellipticum variicoloris]|uniref:DUF885 domain-containing protein n=1 Tax=Planctellipticum variicoloris TaxID=3064265 RepID=UPI0030141A9A|nr:DUF885 domain-containing protein [Planctomycetaceae bacterium SH412]